MKVSISGYGLPTNYTGASTYSSVDAPLPEIESITPNEGFENEETSVTIEGSGFTDAISVRIHTDGSAGNVRDLVIVNDEEITCKVPPRYPGTPDVLNLYIETPTGTATLLNAWTYNEEVIVPTLTSVDSDIVDTLGGEVGLTGTGFTGVEASDVLFDGVAATSIVVDSDTHITAQAPAHAAGTVDVTVAASTLEDAIEYWSPAEFLPTIFYDGNYSVNSEGVDAAWVPRYTTFVAGTIPGGATQPTTANKPADVSDSPEFAHGTNKYLVVSPLNSEVFGAATAFTIIVVLEIDAITSNNATLYQGDGVIIDTGQFLGLLLGGAGQNMASLFTWPSSAKYASVSLGTHPVSGRFVLASKLETNLKITKDGSTWVTGDASSAPSVLSGHSHIGRNSGGSGTSGFSGRIKAMILDDVAWSDANVEKFYRWAAARHP